jgi:zinc protease
MMRPNMTAELARLRAAGAAMLALSMSACATTPQPQQPPATQQAGAPAPDRSVRPAVGEAPDLLLPAIQQFTLGNGMRVLLMEKRDLPLVQVNLILDAGAVFDPSGREGLASLTAAMLDEGAAGMTSLEIADAFEMMGARFGIGAGTHSASMSLRAPTARMPDALRLAADVIRRPEFPQHELDRLRVERLTALVRSHDDPGSIAGTLLDETLFGREHPYGRSGFGTDATLRDISTADMRAFHERFYRPSNATAVMVGDIDTATARRLLEAAFGDWPQAATPTAAVPQAQQVRGRVIYVVDTPGSAQSVVRLGRIGAPRSTTDYYALEVMNVVLGGSFTSRLNQNLREDKGYSYGASSGFSFMPTAGPWSATAAVQTQSTGPAIGEFMNELRGMHQPISEDEVARARNFLAMRYPASFQSVSGLAGRLADMVQYDLPADYFNRYLDNVLAVTRADVERVAREYIDPDNVAIFVVGDRAVIEEQVRRLDLGEVRFLSVVDVLGPVPALE